MSVLEYWDLSGFSGDFACFRGILRVIWGTLGYFGVLCCGIEGFGVFLGFTLGVLGIFEYFRGVLCEIWDFLLLLGFGVCFGSVGLGYLRLRLLCFGLLYFRF